MKNPTLLFTILGGHGYPISCVKLIDDEWVKTKLDNHRNGIRFLTYIEGDVPVWSNQGLGDDNFEVYAGGIAGQPPTPENALAIYESFRKKENWDKSMFQELAFTYSHVDA